MKSTLIGAAVLLAAFPLFASQQSPAQRQTQQRQITFHGCVTAGLEKGTYVLAPVTHLVAPDAGQIPEFAHGRQIFFWLDDDGEVKTHVGRLVEVRGEFAAIEESEIEIKTGRHKDGGVIVEFEGPGRDVRASSAASGAAVGTSGAPAPEKNDIKSYLLRIDVKSVKATGTC